MGSSSYSLFIATFGSLIVGGCAGAWINSKLEAAKRREENGIVAVKSRSLEEDKKAPQEKPVTLSATAFYNAAADSSTTTHINILSDLINRMWPKIRVALSKLLKELVEPMFAESLPSMLSDLKFTKLDLGNEPILIDNILVHPLRRHADSNMEYIQWEWDVSWNSSSNIQLATSNNMIKLGVKTIQLKGRMSLTMQPLSDELPCFDAIHYAFVNPPEIELDFTGLANIADVGMMDIKKMIRQIIQDVISGVVVLPIQMTYVMNPACDFRDMYTSTYMGLARIRVHSGRGFQNEKRTLLKDDIPDVYLKIRLGSEAVWRTTTIKDSLNPQWDASQEWHDFLLCSKEQIIHLEAWDQDGGPMDSDDFLGMASVTVGQVLLLASGAQKTMEVELIQEERKGSIRPTGCFITLSLSMMPFSTKDLSTLKNTVEKKAVAGLLTVLIQQAYNLPINKKDAASFVKVSYGSKELGVTGIVTDLPGYDALNPLYQMPFHLPLTADDKADIKLQLLNKETTLLGEIVVPYDRVLKAENGTVRETSKIGDGGGALAYSVSFAGVQSGALAAASASANATVDRSVDDSPAGASPVNNAPAVVSAGDVDSPVTEKVRVSITKGYGFKVHKKGPFRKKDIPDIYCITKFGSDPTVWRTAVVKDSVSPVWENETRDFPLQSANQVISVDVWDSNRKSKDDLVGNARTSVGKVLLNGGSLDVEVGQNTGIFITVQCQKL